MSADASYNILQSHAEGHIVLPQPVGDLSLIDSVTGFIQEAYVNVLPAETKMGDRILWAKFVPCDVGPEVESAPLILVLAYSTGVQAWSINSTGEAKEVLSWHQGIVKAFQFLPSPSPPVSSHQCARDLYLLKRPLVALCDNGGPSPPFHNVTFLSLATGEQVKHIKFKNEVCEILANRKCIIVTFSEKIAIFDASSLEDKFTITTCYPSPGIKCNPVSLGSRWLAFADRRLLSLCRSYGGYEGEGSVSYTATVLQAAKSLGKGLRELSGTVANSLTGTGHVNSFDSNTQDGLCPGIVTVLDMECKSGENKKEGSIVSHFVAHTTPIVALSFDPTGLLLLTAEKRGHKFNVFRIEPSKAGPSHASVHHLYILHRGDTTARVQDITFSSDSRWVAVSSLRGTTHVFPITMYGGGIGLRTHTTPHVVNRLSRFHKSAGIVSVVTSAAAPGKGHKSPLGGSGTDLSTSPSSSSSVALLAPSSPMVIAPLAQIRRQLSNSSNNTSGSHGGGLGPRQHSADDSSISVKVAACFASPKCSTTHAHPMRDNNHTVSKGVRKSPAPALFLITGHGYLIQYDLEPRPIAGLTKDKLCDDTPIDLHVEPRCQWRLFYPPTAEKTSRVHSDLTQSFVPRQLPHATEHHDKWLSQVEIITHAGPHRRLWMGPQFSFKTYTPPPSGEFSFDNIVTTNVNTMPTRSTPMNIEKSNKNVPVLIETVSTGSSDQSPRFMEELDRWGASHPHHPVGESQLCEDLADAMQETHSAHSHPLSQGVSGSSRVVWVTEKQKDQKSDPGDEEVLLSKEPTGNEPSSKEPTGNEPSRNERSSKEQTRKELPSKEPEEVTIEKESECLITMDSEQVEVVNQSMNIVEDLFSMEDVASTKKNKKKKKEKKEEEVREEIIEFDDSVNVEPTIETVIEQDASNGVESRKKNRKGKKAKDIEPVETLGDKIGEVDESLFEENIDYEEDKTVHHDQEKEQKEEFKEVVIDGNGYANHIEVEDRYDDIEYENRYEEGIEVDAYEEDMEPGYQYEDEIEYDQYDDDIVEDMSNVYIQGDLETEKHPGNEPALISDYPDVQSFIDINRTPAEVLGVDNSLLDSTLGLKKRKNKKKKR
ncbi:breast carcinoma-amplified sequence 3 homolog [Diaphorina citri]|uniref:Breast carcinoma-amplified sequence 3 homolog n=1 Tax=Diaphorina citri TaxID=121845 RepID=A0A3Q0IHL3_DIACI|nr:breast carcinoma-amplified sequence 3 homolog [Diaphorina citri]